MRDPKYHSPTATSPDIVRCATLNDEIGAISIRGGTKAIRISAIGWAILKADDRLISGSIELEWSDTRSPDIDHHVALSMYRSAAASLNACLGTAVVHDMRVLGRNRVDTIYEASDVKPTWKRTDRNPNTFYPELSIRVDENLGLRSYIPFRRDLTPRGYAVQQLRDYRNLRRIVRTTRFILAKSDAMQDETDDDGTSVTIRYPATV